MESSKRQIVGLKMEDLSESLIEGSKTEAHPIWANLRDEVVEKILAMIPFPELLKVRALSKAWYSVLPIPCGRRRQARETFRQKTSVNCECLKGSSRSFQTSVSSVSWRWSVYSPVIVGDNGLLGYDSVLKVWQRLCTANLKPILRQHCEPWLVSSLGPLICGVSQAVDSHGRLIVTNVMTRRSKKLPPHPIKTGPSLLNLTFDGSDSYKIFLVMENPYEGPDDDHDSSKFRGSSHRCVSSQLFDSRKGTWMLKQTRLPIATSFAWKSCSVYHKGIIYCLSGDDRCPISHPMQVWAYNLEEGVWSEIRHPFEHMVNRFSGTVVITDLSRFQLLVCEDTVLMVLALNWKEPHQNVIPANSVFIYELDSDSRIISQKYSGPSVDLVGTSEHIVSDGENVYFCTVDLTLELPMVAFNMKSGGWSFIRADFAARELISDQPLMNKCLAGFSFQPGLNPFIVP